MKEDVDLRGLFDKDGKYHKSGDFDIDEYIRKIKGESPPKNKISMNDGHRQMFPGGTTAGFGWLYIAIFCATVALVLNQMFGLF